MLYGNSVSFVNMDSDMFGVPIDIPSHATHSLVQSDSYYLNSQDQMMPGFPVLSTMPGPTVNDLYAELHMTNHVGIVDPDVMVSSRGRNVARENSNNSYSHAGSIDLEGQFTGSTIISGASLATLLAPRGNLQENLNSLVISAAPIHPSDVTRTHVVCSYSDALNLSFATSMYDEVVGNESRRWDFDKFPVSPELGEKSMDPNGWISSNSTASMSADHPYGSSKFCNELSLSLATSQSSVSRTSTVPDQCSERSCSVVTHHCLNETALGSEQNSYNSKELFLSFGYQKHPLSSQASQATLGSRYLQIIQEILAQIASYSLENLDQMSYSTAGIRAESNIEYSSCPADRGMFISSQADDRLDVQLDPALQNRAVETKKTQLLSLLQVVDDRYNQCMDEIHTVISAFHAVTELDPQKHGSFALRTISFLYKSLRERISNQILSMGAEFNTKGTREDRSFEASFIQKQWAIQQQKRKEHQLWRPQRGLPEKSVSVLRAWMFQNFLHPYPKDAEKHLLAIKSGLSRSQVSNWFINARVRLWKPMIEEMYSEMNKRKGRDEYEEGGNRSMNNQRYSVNWS